ncbi:leucine-rich repeat and immunoglobulin-like domain-containing nogo receptor-interacting protein 4 [Dermacentor albipictus]|uniref:leucine-rich repeat and immunoglobulin-like domain-containing nogo receptor-interacting protein 4 n=1 Tax=Dermacentor albipictus TaxID=60249 RepID=UPI0031FCE25D
MSRTRERHCSGVAVVLAALAAVAVATPSCLDTSNHYYDEREYTCSGFTSASHFHEHIPRDLTYPRLRFVLKECLVEYIPGSAFTSVPALSLDLNNCKAKTFSKPGANPFDGLEETVSRIGFMHNSTLPESWQLLKNLNRLKEVAFYMMAGLDLTRDFNNLPQSLRRVLIFRSSIARIDDNWLSGLTNLEEVWIQESDLKHFQRSMMPRPAPKLWRLHLQGCGLTSLPRDFSDDLPAMRHLSIEENLITTFDELSLEPLKRERTYVGLYGNPLHCDCRIKFLLSYSYNWRFPVCATPEFLKGRRLNDLSEDLLNCSSPTTTTTTTTTTPVAVPGGFFPFYSDDV